MGNSLKPYRDKVYLACKTAQRKRVEAEKEMLESLKLLHTDYFDVYQLHGLTSMEELETCFAPGGAMERRKRESREKSALQRTASRQPCARWNCMILIQSCFP